MSQQGCCVRRGRCWAGWRRRRAGGSASRPARRPAWRCSRTPRAARRRPRATARSARSARARSRSPRSTAAAATRTWCAHTRAHAHARACADGVHRWCVRRSPPLGTAQAAARLAGLLQPCVWLMRWNSWAAGAHACSGAAAPLPTSAHDRVNQGTWKDSLACVSAQTCSRDMLAARAGGGARACGGGGRARGGRAAGRPGGAPAGGRRHQVRRLPLLGGVAPRRGARRERRRAGAAGAPLRRPRRQQGPCVVCQARNAQGVAWPYLQHLPDLLQLAFREHAAGSGFGQTLWTRLQRVARKVLAPSQKNVLYRRSLVLSPAGS